MLLKGKQFKDNSIPLAKIQAIFENNSLNYNGDYSLIPATTDGNYQSTGLSPTQEPAPNAAFYVLVNGVTTSLGNGTRDAQCYFSIDGGLTAQNIVDISTNSVLFWNGVISKFDLETTDRVSFVYEIDSGAIPGVGNESVVAPINLTATNGVVTIDGSISQSYLLSINTNFEIQITNPSHGSLNDITIQRTATESIVLSLPANSISNSNATPLNLDNPELQLLGYTSTVSLPANCKIYKLSIEAINLNDQFFYFIGLLESQSFTV